MNMEQNIYGRTLPGTLAILDIVSEIIRIYNGLNTDDINTDNVIWKKGSNPDKFVNLMNVQAIDLIIKKNEHSHWYKHINRNEIIRKLSIYQNGKYSVDDDMSSDKLESHLCETYKIVMKESTI